MVYDTILRCGRVIGPGKTMENNILVVGLPLEQVRHPAITAALWHPSVRSKNSPKISSRSLAEYLF